MLFFLFCFFFFSSRRRHTRCALVTGVQTCALPICSDEGQRARLVDQVAGDRAVRAGAEPRRSEEHTSELQSLMRISYAVFCLKKNKYDRPLLLTENILRTKTSKRPLHDTLPQHQAYNRLSPKSKNST